MSDEILNVEQTVAADTPKKIELIRVNFKEGKILDKVQFDEDAGIPKVLREIAKFAKKTNVKSIVLLTIDDKDHVDWVHIAENEHHLALAALTLEDVREDIKAKIFGSEE